MNDTDWKNVETITFMAGAFFCAGMGRSLAAVVIIALYAAIHFVTAWSDRKKPPTTD